METDKNSIETAAKTSSENRSIVTSYAFGVSKDLIGTRLASPLARFCAILIDLLVIAMLSSLHTTLLVFAAIHLAFWLVFRKKIRKWNRKFLSLYGILVCALMLFFSTSNTLPAPSEENSLPIATAIPLAANFIKLETCGDTRCRETTIQEIIAMRHDPNLSAQMKLEISLATRSAIESISVSQDDKQHLATLLERGTEQKAQAASEEKALPTAKLTTDKDQTSASDNPTNTTRIGITAWIKAIFTDLGIGVGLAAIYFSLLTAEMGGQTIGKIIFRIQVVRLDGKNPTLWESFGRYGGYSAGISTGLLGFLQIFWDPNRQAIQDKISETLVIRKPTTPLLDIIKQHYKNARRKFALM